MIIAAALFGYAALVALATRLLRRPWSQRAPRLAIALWQLGLATILAAAVLGLLALTVPLAARDGLAGLLNACVMALRAAYRSPLSEHLVFLLGLGLAAVLLVRIAGCLAGEWWRASRERRQHLDALALLGHRDSRLGVTVLEHADPAAYCVPGRHQRIVLTTATLAALDGGQLAQVLRHERAHLDGRHDLILAVARALARAVPLPVFRVAVRELGTLVEMLADDAARTPQQRLTLASALVSLATREPISPTVALAAAVVGVLTRVRRLTGPNRPFPQALTAAALLLGMAVATAPLVIALAPIVTAAALPYCPVTSG
jgi:Zn-dependent protease with chaperone function